MSRRGGLVLQPDAVEAFETVQRDPESQSIRQKLGDFTVTAYALTANSTGKSPGQPGFGITASGSRASVGRTVAVDPSVIPIGSLVYIDLPGIGWRLAEDTGGAIKGRHIDLLLPSDGAAIQFGIKHSVPVYTMSR
ncbi:3D domain-containing protein [Alicyclobacillus curvatus]|nr:3D domain-containing protein [Alicyclobacillus curvatus]